MRSSVRKSDYATVEKISVYILFLKFKGYETRISKL